MQDSTLLLQAHRALGISLFYLGELAPCHAHLAQGAALYDPQQHRVLAFSTFQNPGVTCRGFVVRSLWYLGFPDQVLAQDVVHPFSLAFALNVAALVQQLRREGHGVQERAEATVTLAREAGLFVLRGAWDDPAGLVPGRPGTARRGALST